MAQRSAPTSVVFATGFWQTQSGPATTAPGNGKYNADNWASPTLLAIAALDNNGYDRRAGLLSLRPGDQISELGTNDSQNYQVWSVTSVTDHTTWVQVGVGVIGAGSSFVTPGMNQTRILQAIQVVSQEIPPAGQTSGPLPSLASPDDIVARLGRNLNQTEMARIDALLRDGSAIIRRYCRQDFTWVEDDVIKVHADGGIIVLPWKPVDSITEVIAISGVPGIPDIPVTWYHFDDVDTITVMNPSQSGIINLPEFWYEETFWWGGSFRVKGAHGYRETPDDVTAVLCTAIISELSTPTMSATLASESIGAYSYSMRRTSGAGLSAALVDAGMKTSLSDYRKTQGTIKVRMLCRLPTARRSRSGDDPSPARTAMATTPTHLWRRISLPVRYSRAGAVRSYSLPTG